MKNYVKKSSMIILLVGIFILTAGLSIQYVYAQEGYIIRDIKFIGNNFFSPGELSSHITLRGTSKFKQIVLRKKPVLFDEKTLQIDLNKIQKFYQSEGFLDVKVTSRLETNREGNTVNIFIQISEGDPIHVQQIGYQFNIHGDTTDGKSSHQLIEKVKSSFNLKPEIRFRDVLLKADEDLILKKFSNEGYPYIQVHPKFNINQKNKLVDIKYQIDPGNFCYFGEVSIAQNTKTPGSVIRKHLVFKKGNIFNQNLIEKSQLQVYQLGFFQSVTIKAMMNKREDNAIPIQILVKEAPRLTMKVGYGYGIEEKFRIYTDILRLGFLGGARRLNLYIKHSKLEPYNLNLKFTQPAFIKLMTTLQLNSFFMREDEPGYKLSRVGGTITLQQQFSTRTNAYLGYILEQDNLVISPETQVQILNNQNLSYYNKSMVKIGLVRDTSGPIFSPNHGFFAAFDYTLSGLDFNSKFDFTKVLSEFRNYQQVAQSFIFAYKLKVGVMKPIWGNEVTPIEERFFSGGSMSVRGWQRSQLGPKNTENDPIGGNSLLEGSAEIRYPIWNIFSGAAFLDYGNVWTKSFNYNLRELHYAAGFGIRAKTPIGPIRFDVARPIHDVEKQIQIYLNVGQAF